MRRCTSASTLFLFFVICVCLTGCGKKDLNIYCLGRDSSWYPLELLGKEKNMVAFTNEMMRAVAKERGFRFELIETHSQFQLEHLDRGILDGVLSTVSKDALPKGVYLQSEPFFFSGPVIVTRIDSEIRHFQDLQGKIVGTLEEAALDFDEDTFETIRFVSYASLRESLDELEDDLVDALILPLVPAYIYTNRFYSQSLKIASLPLNRDGVRLVTLKGVKGEKLINDFNEGVIILREKGILQDLIKKWTLADAGF